TPDVRPRSRTVANVRAPLPTLAHRRAPLRTWVSGFLRFWLLGFSVFGFWVSGFLGFSVSGFLVSGFLGLWLLFVLCCFLAFLRSSLK
ncbi:hypothetical protein S83_059865, partial [Arachis hypogaea]